MLYYQSPDMRLHALEDAAYEHLLPPGSVPVKAPAVESPSAGDLRAAKLAEINATCNRELAQLTAAYPEMEVTSWAKQEAEARQLLRDATTATPLLDAIAATRGVERGELAQRVVAKSDAYALASGQLIGRRQALEDQLLAIDLAAPDAAARIAAVQWEVL